MVKFRHNRFLKGRQDAVIPEHKDENIENQRHLNELNIIQPNMGKSQMIEYYLFLLLNLTKKNL
jgi:hypothetical protein